MCNTISYKINNWNLSIWAPKLKQKGGTTDSLYTCVYEMVAHTTFTLDKVTAEVGGG